MSLFECISERYSKQPVFMSLKEELIDIVFEVCDVKDKTRDDLISDQPLIGPESALGLDSLDSLEIVVTVGKRYGVRIANKDTALKVLKTLDTLVGFIQENRTK